MNYKEPIKSVISNKIDDLNSNIHDITKVENFGLSLLVISLIFAIILFVLSYVYELSEETIIVSGIFLLLAIKVSAFIFYRAIVANIINLITIRFLKTVDRFIAKTNSTFAQVAKSFFQNNDPSPSKTSEVRILKNGSQSQSETKLKHLINMEKRYALYADFYHKHEEVVTWEQAHKRLLKYYLSDLDENTVHDYINPDPSTFYQAYHNHIKRN